MPPLRPPTHAVWEPEPGAQLRRSQLQRIKGFLPGKKAEGDIKPDQRLLGTGRHVGDEMGLPLRGGCK